MEERGLRAAEGPSTSVQLMTLSAVTCRIRWCRGFTFAERYTSMYDFYSECVRKGCILSDEPLFTISDRQDYWEGIIREAPYPYAVCVPVRPETAPADAVTLPECRAFWASSRPTRAGRSRPATIAPGSFCRCGNDPPAKYKKADEQNRSSAWWERVDSNHRRHCQQIYSLPPLATREHSHIPFAETPEMELVDGFEPPTC